MPDTGGVRGETFRGFVALPLPAEVQERAGQVVERLRAGEADGPLPDVRWTATENFHLTLKFLGSVPRTSLSELGAALGEVAAAAAPFTLALGGLGAFPRPTRPQVIWIGVTEGEGPLTALATGVEAACARMGFPAEERPFRAHLTLGRARGERGAPPPRGGHKGPPLPERLQAAGVVELGTVQADRFHLMQSVLTPRGPIYTVVTTFQLGSGVREGAPVG